MSSPQCPGAVSWLLGRLKWGQLASYGAYRRTCRDEWYELSPAGLLQVRHMGYNHANVAQQREFPVQFHWHRECRSRFRPCDRRVSDPRMAGRGRNRQLEFHQQDRCQFVTLRRQRDLGRAERQLRSANRRWCKERDRSPSIAVEAGWTLRASTFSHARVLTFRWARSERRDLLAKKFPAVQAFAQLRRQSCFFANQVASVG